MNKRVLAFLFSALAVTGCMSGDIGPLSERFIPEQKSDCSPTGSRRIDLKAFEQSPDRFAGRCVQVHGYVIEQRLYADLDSFYSLGGGLLERLSGTGAVGLYDEPLERNPFKRQYVEITGFTFTCELSREANRRYREAAKARGDYEEVLVEDDSFCGTGARPGPYLVVSQWRPIPGMRTSISGGAAAERYGNLIEIDDSWPHAVDARQFISEWFGAAAAGDKTRLARLQSDQPNDRLEMRFEALLRLDESPLRFLVGASNRTIKYYPIKAQTVMNENVEYEAFGCVCKTGDCSDQWPIHDADAEAGFMIDLPFACIHIERWNVDGKSFIGTTPNFFLFL